MTVPHTGPVVRAPGVADAVAAHARARTARVLGAPPDAGRALRQRRADDRGPAGRRGGGTDRDRCRVDLPQPRDARGGRAGPPLPPRPLAGAVCARRRRACTSTWCAPRAGASSPWTLTSWTRSAGCSGHGSGGRPTSPTTRSSGCARRAPAAGRHELRLAVRPGGARRRVAYWTLRRRAAAGCAAGGVRPGTPARVGSGPPGGGDLVDGLRPGRHSCGGTSWCVVGGGPRGHADRDRGAPDPVQVRAARVAGEWGREGGGRGDPRAGGPGDLQVAARRLPLRAPRAPCSGDPRRRHAATSSEGPRQTTPTPPPARPPRRSPSAHCTEWRAPARSCCC